MTNPTNKVANLVRMYRYARKQALKDLGPLIHDPDTDQTTITELLEKTTDTKMQIELNYLDNALKYANQFDEILERNGICKANPKLLKDNYFFITIRPGDEHKHRFSEFKHLITTKYLTRSMFTSYRYAYEQKGETTEDIGKGYHIHIIAHCPNYLKKTQLIKDTKSTFNKFCNGEVPDAFVQVDYVKTLDHYNNIHAYMSGYKADDWKDKACAMDKPWREKLGLEDSYGELSSKSEA